MGWLFGGKNSKFNKPVPAPEPNVVPFRKKEIARAIPIKVIPNDSPIEFKEVPFADFVATMERALRDMQAGLIDPSGGMIVLFDKKSDTIVWYQNGFKEGEEDIFLDWIDAYFK